MVANECSFINGIQMPVTGFEEELFERAQKNPDPFTLGYN